MTDSFKRGKIVNFTNGSRLDMKTITENDKLYSIQRINLEDVIVTFNEDFQIHALGLDGNNKQVVSSIDSLRRSISLFGQIQPIIVSIVNDPVKESFKAMPNQKYQIIDGLKRYAIAVDAGKKEIKAIVINKVIKDSKSILRFLINQTVQKSPESIVDEANYVRNRTDSLQESFIEQILGIDVGSLEILSRAFKSEDKLKQKLIERYRNNEITLKTLVRKLDPKKEDFKKTADMLNEYQQEQSEKIGVAQAKAQERFEKDGFKQKAVIENNLDEMDARYESSNNSVRDKKLNENIENGSLNKSSSKQNKNNYDESNSIDNAENYLRDKQQKNNQVAAQLTKQIEENNSERQYVGDRKPLEKSKRLAVLARDEYRCQCCGLGGETQPSLVATFEIHHLIDVQLGGGDNVDNLVLLCKQCHSLITNYTKAFPNKPHQSFVPEYNPSQEELDMSPNKWIIPLLGKIEGEAYKEAFAQINNLDSKVGKDIKHRAITIGQGIKKMKNRLIIKHNVDTRKIFVNGLIGLYNSKKDLGFKIYNKEILEQVENKE